MKKTRMYNKTALKQTNRLKKLPTFFFKWKRKTYKNINDKKINMNEVERENKRNY